MNIGRIWLVDQDGNVIRAHVVDLADAEKPSARQISHAGWYGRRVQSSRRQMP